MLFIGLLGLLAVVILFHLHHMDRPKKRKPRYNFLAIWRDDRGQEYSKRYVVPGNYMSDPSGWILRQEISYLVDIEPINPL